MSFSVIVGACEGSYACSMCHVIVQVCVFETCLFLEEEDGDRERTVSIILFINAQLRAVIPYLYKYPLY